MTDATPTPNAPRGFSAWAALRLALALGLVAWVARLVVLQSRAAGSLPVPQPGWLALAVVVLAGYYALMNDTWVVLMRGLRAPLPWSRAFRILYLSNLSKYLPGGVWYLFGRVAMCKAEGIPAATTSLSLLVETVAQCAVMAVVAMVTLSNAAAALLPVGRFALLGGAVAVLACVHPRVVDGLLGFVGRLAGREVPRFDVGYRLVLVAFARYLVAWLLVALAFGLFARALGGAVDVERAMLLTGALSVSWLVALLAFVLPGGLGLREVLLTSILELRYGAALAAALALGFRVGLVVLETLAFTVALALRPAAPTHAD